MISPLENNGIISRTQDISIIKHNEDVRAEVLQSHVQDSFESRQDQYIHSVHRSNDSDAPDTHHDAREKGKNQYFNQRNKQKKEQPDSKQDRVLKKGSIHGFDIKI